MRTQIFIDGGGIYSAAQVLGKVLDYKKLHAYHSEQDAGATFEYFTIAVLDADGQSTVVKLNDWMAYNGFRLNEIQIDSTSSANLSNTRPRLLADMAVKMVNAARAGLDRAVIYSGDEALTSAVKSMQRDGCHVCVTFNREKCGDDLRRQADTFAELAGLESHGVLKIREPRAATA